MFSGRNDDWPVWSARFGAYAELAGWTGVLEVAEAQTAPISMVGTSLEAIRLGKIIYAVLLTKTEGKAFQHCSSHTQGGARLGNMVRKVVCPRDQWLADVSEVKDFLTSLIEWEIKVAVYEVASGDRISEAVRVATIMDHAPDAIKSVIRLSLLEQRRSVDALTLWIRESSYATLGLFQGSMPMQVGAVSDGGKGKKGKSKSTGHKRQGQRRRQEQGTRRLEHRSAASEIPEILLTLLEVEPQSRIRLAQQKNGAVADVQELEFETEDVKAAQWSDVDSEDVDMDSSSWCFAALNNPRGPAGILLVDSGADDHICHPDFTKTKNPLKKSAGVKLRDVQGNPLSHHGTRHVNPSVGTR